MDDFCNQMIKGTIETIENRDTKSFYDRSIWETPFENEYLSDNSQLDASTIPVKNK